MAIVKGTQSELVISHILKIKRKLRIKVKEITLDMAGSMKLIARRCFPGASQVIDRFHVQKLAIEALQEIRIRHRWKAIEMENKTMEGLDQQQALKTEIFENGDSRKQLLARSRYLLYKSREKMDIFSKAKGLDSFCPISGSGESLPPDRWTSEDL